MNYERCNSQPVNSLNSFVVINRMKNILDQDGVLKASRPDEHVSLAPVEGSFYIELMAGLRKKLNTKGDWIWLKNCLTNDILMGSEIEKLTKRYLFKLFKVL